MNPSPSSVNIKVNMGNVLNKKKKMKDTTSTEQTSLTSNFRLGPVSSKVFKAGDKFLSKQNFDFKILYKLRSFVEQDDQLGDVSEEKKVLSYGVEAGKLGQAAVDNAKFGLNSMKSLFLTILETTSEEFDKTIGIIARELREHDSYQHLIRVYACKKENL
ncbi:18533_t:CDS:2 [Acaulospora morrowiae]|uniref:18533_t:CDS:1 n=1 Tax=Acaulospora morrowiae TaxID=94023 RepID=A0A9N8VSH0_9GLOM|nr:18533_t:CDS:2 [Acaulospora morrowiae]